MQQKNCCDTTQGAKASTATVAVAEVDTLH
jgi:hypothetical protein